MIRQSMPSGSTRGRERFGEKIMRPSKAGLHIADGSDLRAGNVN
jgi:hypothetical protein